VLEENVWIGEDAMICKGVKIGANSIIGARSVVTKDIPKNTIYAGNPAVFIRDLNESEFITREDFFHDPTQLAKDFDLLDRYTLDQNSFLGWIKSIIFRDKSH
jgi:serine acetyltransferase